MTRDTMSCTRNVTVDTFYYKMTWHVSPSLPFPPSLPAPSRRAGGRQARLASDGTEESTSVDQLKALKVLRLFRLAKLLR